MTHFRTSSCHALFSFAFVLSVAACLPQPAVAQMEQSSATKTAETAHAFRNLEAVAERFVAEGKVANMVIGVSMPNGQDVWIRQGTLAFNSDVPANEHSLYRIYSMTKMITAVAATLFIEEGEIGLDQPISDFIPAFADVQVLVDQDTFGDTRAPASPITVRHLLTHTSGLGYSIIPSAIAEAYAEAGIAPGLRLPSPLPTSGSEPTSLQEFAERVATLPLRVDPGTEWHYSISLDVLAAVIEQAANMPFEQVLKERIFQPLRMDNTSFVVSAENLERLTTNYVLSNGSIVSYDNPANSEYAAVPNYPSGGAGLVSTPDDYLRFMTAMANGGRLEDTQVLPAVAVDLATSNLLPSDVGFNGFGAFAANNQGFGAGGRVIIDASQGEPVGTYGFGSAASTLATARPRQNVSLVMMTQMLFANDLGMMQATGAALAADLAAMQADAR